jgi:hypothetical protein
MHKEDNLMMQYTDGWGKRVERSVYQTIDARDFLGTPGYPWIVIAANPQLSAAELETWLNIEARDTPGVGRSLSWIKRRRWMFQHPGNRSAVGPKPDRDGNMARAIKIMARHPTVSLRSLAILLRESGVKRSKEWIRKHRCDGAEQHQ